jgi:hypothetical protein
MQSGRKEQAMAHVAAAKQNRSPVTSARFALITLSATATTATDDQDATTQFEPALAVVTTAAKAVGAGLKRHLIIYRNRQT